MGVSFGLAFVAGALSTLSPCVLPLLPVVLTAATRQHRLAPLALAGGLAFSFTLIALTVASLGFAGGIDAGVVRTAAAVLMAAMGAVLLVPKLRAAMTHGLSSRLGGATERWLSRVGGTGIGGQAALGVVLGAAWSPCAGPSLGAASGLAAQAGGLGPAAGIMAVFSLGAVSPLVLLSYGGAGLLGGKAGLAGAVRWLTPLLGASLLVMGLLVASGLDRTAETYLTAAMPDWLVSLTTRY